jgi:hypothetical protein
MTGRPITVDVFNGSGRTDQGSVYSQEGTGPILGPGMYHATTQEGAAEFGPNVSPSKVTLQNPLVIESDVQWRDLVKNKAGWPFPNIFGLPVEEINQHVARLNDVIRKSGHDGIIIRLDPNSDRTKTMSKVFGQSQVYVPGEPPKGQDRGQAPPQPTNPQPLHPQQAKAASDALDAAKVAHAQGDPYVAAQILRAGQMAANAQPIPAKPAKPTPPAASTVA